MIMNSIERCEARIIEDYRAKTLKSQKLFQRAKKVLPGGVSGNLRYFYPHPLYMSGGNGAIVFDIDRNKYIDCFLCNGPLLLGHRPPEVLNAIKQNESIGSLVVNPSLMVDCAERLCEIVKCAEQVRFLNTGTEAVLTAVRLSRAFTGRSKIIKFFGHYHGQDDQFLVGLTPERKAYGKGVPETAYANTLTIPFNDINAVRDAILKDGDVAAVILDPAMHNGGLWGTTKEYLEALRQLTKKNGVLLIFDEVITGFRLAPGGAQQYYGVTPDLATFAKALGAGEKIAAVAGSADIFKVVDPVEGDRDRRVFQSGTVNDGTNALSAAIAAMDCYREYGKKGDYAKLADLGENLEKGLTSVFTDANIPCRINHQNSMLQIFLTDKEPNYFNYSKLDMKLLDLFYLSLINRGVLLSLPTSNHIYLSFKHRQEDIDRIIDVSREVISYYGFEEAFEEISTTNEF
jgi:glutamate-1-semialdehyde 2,1-aminomutase